MVFPEEEPAGDCYNYNLVEDGRTAPGMCGYGGVTLSHTGSRRYENWPRGYKTFFILNSVEYEILNAHKYKNIKKFSMF